MGVLFLFCNIQEVILMHDIHLQFVVAAPTIKGSKEKEHELEEEHFLADFWYDNCV